MQSFITFPLEFPNGPQMTSGPHVSSSSRLRTTMSSVIWRHYSKQYILLPGSWTQRGGGKKFLMHDSNHTLSYTSVTQMLRGVF